MDVSAGLPSNPNPRPSGAPPAQRLELKVSSDPGNIADVRHAVEDFSARLGFDEKAVGEIGLCINEAMANVIRHAYGGATDRPMEIFVESRATDLLIQIRDWGSGVTPSLDHQHDPSKPGGLGMICLKQLMNDVRFQRLPDGMLVTMKRKIPSGRGI